jgi:hypothetical protein
MWRARGQRGKYAGCDNHSFPELFGAQSRQDTGKTGNHQEH